ncbi:glycosyltransferase family 2 protein [Candidatus Bipolaricaulota bacterium]|nr:glycosyltransferase family 2 protein [Candidatus Bipolaricaulota bacterium]
MAAPQVTVVVPVLNEEGTLEETLRSLRAQTWRDFELLVVDNGSTDRSPQIAARFADRVIVEPKRGALPAMHRGFSEARGAFVVGADADTVYPPRWLERMVRELRREGTVAVYGPMGFRESGRVRRALEAAGYCVLAWLSLLCRVHLCGAANMGMRREVYLAVGGYPPLEDRASPDFRLARLLEGVGRVRFVPTILCYTSNRRFVRSGWVRGAARAFWYWLDMATGRDRIPGQRYWTDLQGSREPKGR